MVVSTEITRGMHHSMTQHGNTYADRFVPNEETTDRQERVNLNVSGKEKVDQLRAIFQRALNTWESPPEWAMEFCDMIHKTGE